ncbi:serine/threonine protein kinase [Anabaena sp. FACHB-1237]|uniref:serine/threonine-protein kinase n=1 Tax=Anabaena sp. FACHB-1237 TaxID=2692769 RepID=UPI001680D90E|nr:serine/threonine-protein kinase [Anabaena sp. FACHB-1237]MBD2136773.1 serine/threonine protein kinase [Anabaena sp. FACHB-1237]
MSYCLHAHCSKPENPDDVKFCLTCGTKLLLKERYRAIKPIGQGGFGRTFLAVDEDKPSKPPCVIKQFYPQAQGTNTAQKAIELFNQEAVQLDDLGQHPQIPELLAYFTQDNRQYLVQEFINGLNLHQELIKNGVFNEDKIRLLLNDLLPVLQFCHNKKVIHRDIKPENIIRRSSDNKLVIVDFGAAKSATATALNQTGTSIGSPEYVAPEQMRGKAIFASDIYSLGVTCINLLTGRSPFDSYDSHNGVWIWQHFLKTPVSQQLTNIINKMVESIPSQRYQKVAEIIQDLNHVNPNLSQKPKQPSTTLPTTPIKPVIARDPAIERELQEMKTQFTSSQGKPQANDPIEKELQEMKAKFRQNP